jgi:general secretion pathway protein D
VVKVNVLKNGTEEPAKAEAPKPAAEAPKAEPPKTEAPKAAAPAADAPKPAMPAALAGLLGLPGGGLGARAQPGPGAPKLTMQTAASAVKLASAVTVTLQLDNAADLFGAPMRVKWDPKILRLNEAARGTLFNADGQPPVFTRNIRNDEGEATIVLNRAAGAAGVSGTGSLVVLTFQAVGKGATMVTLPEVTLRNSQMQPIATEAPSATVTVE